MGKLSFLKEFKVFPTFFAKKAKIFWKPVRIFFTNRQKKAKEGRWRRKKGRKVDEEMAKVR